MKKLSQTTQFSKDIKRMKKRGKDLDKLKGVVEKLATGVSLEPRHRDHPLAGTWKHARDCHIEPDWLLIYTWTINHFALNGRARTAIFLDSRVLKNETVGAAACVRCTTNQ